MAAIILHHYEDSPFSEKVRLALGIKNLSWHSVIIPNMMPKPLYTPLTGGYRRTPAMQIGADVYCDSHTIIRELQRRFPDPTLFPDGGEGLHHAIGTWADGPFFEAARGLILDKLHDQLPAALLDDRSQMRETVFDRAALRAAVPQLWDQLRGHAELIESQLRDGRRFLVGDQPALADVHAYFVPWFVHRVFPDAAKTTNRFPNLVAWEARVAQIGHGARTEISAEAALRIAADAQPTTLPDVDGEDPLGLSAGDWVRVRPDDYAREWVEGALVSSSPQQIALLLNPDDLGEVVVHFPRIGYDVHRAPGHSHARPTTGRAT